MKVLSLFSGIGGLDLGFEWAGFETVAFCEIEEFPQKVLNKHWHNVPIIEDVRNVTKESVPGRIDVIIGGFPCQDISVAGDRAGINDGTRSGLWIEQMRTIREIRPKYAVIENVANLVGFGLERVLCDLAEDGRDASWAVIPASAVGADHRRDRIFIVSYLANNGGIGVQGSVEKPFPWLSALQRFKDGGGLARWSERSTKNIDPFRRSPNGVSTRVYNDRIKGLGNAVVPQVAYLVAMAVRQHAEENGVWEV